MSGRVKRGEPAPFDPEAMLRALERHHVQYVVIGGVAAALHGSPYVTTDLDVTPAREMPNLVRLAAALDEMDARVRAPGEPRGLSFDRSAAMLARVSVLNLTTRHGDLDLAFEPSGTQGYDDLRRGAVILRLRRMQVAVARLSDVIRSKEAAGREKDRVVLPMLRRLLERSGEE